MTASTTTKGDKYYIVLSWYIDGKRKQKWVKTDIPASGNNVRKAEKKRLEVLSEWQSKISLNGNDMLFSEYLKQWLEDTRSSISESTYHTYHQTIHNSIAPYFESKKIKLFDLKPYHIQEFYNYKLFNDGVTANTVLHYHANIHKALSCAVKTERIKDNPADRVDLPKKEKYIADYYSVEELKKLLECIKGSVLEPVILLAAWFGLRRGEALGVRWSSIDFENKTLSILGTVKDKGLSKRENKLRYENTAKTSSSLRTFPMPDSAIEYFRALKETQEVRKAKAENYNHTWDDFVCTRANGDLIRLDYVTKYFPLICVKNGLRRITFHGLRHSNITALLNSNASMKELQIWAGHSNYSTTANTYAHIQTESKIKLSETMQNILG